jgi:hypothetical protein
MEKISIKVVAGVLTVIVGSEIVQDKIVFDPHPDSETGHDSLLTEVVQNGSSATAYQIGHSGVEWAYPSED